MTVEVLFNAGGTGEGGGGTYVLAVARELGRGGLRGVRWRFLVQDALAGPLAATPVTVERLPAVSPPLRLGWEQAVLARSHGEALVAAASFGPLARRTPYLLVTHSTLHYQPVPFGGQRGARQRVEAVLARAAARRAPVVITPSAGMAELVARWARRPPRVLPFGPGLAEERVTAADDRFTFLHRTHWGPHKELATLLRAVKRVAEHAPGRFVVRTACDPSTAFARSFQSSAVERALLSDPVVRRHVVVEAFALGSETQRRLAGDAVLVPSRTESFSFPLAEGVAMDLPVVAADRPYAREMCGDAAWLFPVGEEAALADAMCRLLAGEKPAAPDTEHRARLSWARHVDGLAETCLSLSSRSSTRGNR